MPGTAASADDSIRDSNNSHAAPISPLLAAKLAENINPEIARKVRAVVDRKR